MLTHAHSSDSSAILDSVHQFTSLVSTQTLAYFLAM